MMTLCDFKNALRDRIEKKTNMLTVTDSFGGKAERGYALLADEKETSVIDGGRQIQRCFEVSVVILSPKSEEGIMKKRLYETIFPWFELGDRRFVPLGAKDTKKEGRETVTFNVEFCDTLEREEAEVQLMGNITLNIISGGANGITGNSHQL